MCSSFYRHVPFNKRKALASNSSLWVPCPVGAEVNTQPEGEEESGRGKSGFKQSSVLP